MLNRQLFKLFIFLQALSISVIANESRPYQGEVVEIQCSLQELQEQGDLNNDDDCLVVLSTTDWLEIQPDETFVVRDDLKGDVEKKVILIVRSGFLQNKEAPKLAKDDEIKIDPKFIKPVFKRSVQFRSKKAVETKNIDFVVFLSKSARYSLVEEQ